MTIRDRGERRGRTDCCECRASVNCRLDDNRLYNVMGTGRYTNLREIIKHVCTIMRLRFDSIFDLSVPGAGLLAELPTIEDRELNSDVALQIRTGFV